MSNVKSNKFFLWLVVFVCTSFSCKSARESHLSLQWEKKASGVWSCSIGKKEKIDLLGAAGIHSRMEALNQKNEVAFPFDPTLIKTTALNGKLYLRFPLDNDEQIYRLGLQFKDVNRRQKVHQLHVDHYGGQDNGRKHAPVPFYVSSKGYGVLINSARYLIVYVGTTVRLDSPNQPEVRDRNTNKAWTSRPKSDAVEILVPAEGAEVIVSGSESPLDVVSRYNLYCGGGCLPPKWGLGFTYRTHRLYSADDVVDEVKEFEQKNFRLILSDWSLAGKACPILVPTNGIPDDFPIRKNLFRNFCK